MENFMFNSYEHVLLARYHRDIKLNHKDAWLRLSTAERNAICRSKAQQAGKPTAGRPFWSDHALLRLSDINKLTRMFPVLKEKLGLLETESIWTEALRKRLFNILRRGALEGEQDFIWLAKLVQMMNDAEDANIAFSAGNTGVNVTANAIDIVDIEAGKSMATIRLEVWNETTV